MRQSISITIVFLTIWAWFGGIAELAAQENSPQHHSSAITTSDPDVPLDELVLQLKPMTAEELQAEGEGWFKLLKAAVLELNQAKLEVKRQNIIIKESATVDGVQKHPAGQVEADQAENEKDQTLEHITQLRETRTELVDRLALVLDELNHKIGLTEDGKEKEEVLSYRHYIKSVHGISVDVSDTKSTWKTLVSWLESKEGEIGRASCRERV